MSDPRETLARIRAQADAATEGPWAVSMDRIEHTGGSEYAVAYDVAREEDAAFIAAARTTVPALVDALEAVLEVHKPDYTYPECPKCIECSDLASTEDRKFVVLWPCPTVQAITDALDTNH